ncbi:DMT family transporter [Natronorubrum thiooxidans]|uniref:Threonine/homoserine efflux transporter RhtA n=1 Tax=Natronorubrum thiooxidans TaxID=308853 RepID=A0A1N7H533_9EURY|nr:EamA family transporter [Natronorubrum thiooxidans]SIS19977.1 Threonine/homoserine efflux transporter RhtA [Natronorubrum thiooxidans]
MKDETVGIVLVLISAIGFGTLGIFGMLAAGEEVSIPTVLALRFGLATVVVWTVLRLRGRFQVLTGRTLAIALALGGIGYATQSGLYFFGLEFMTAGMVAIVLYTYPAFVVCIVAITNPSRVTRRVVIALGLSVSGVALITGADPVGVDPRGIVIVLGAALAYSLYIVVSQQALVTTDAETLTAFVLPAAAGSFVAFGVGTDTLTMPGSVSAWGVIVAIAIFATVVPVLTFFAGIAKIGASRASIISTAEPVVTVTLGVLVLGESVTVVTIVGGTLVITGVVLIQLEYS